LGRGKNKGGLGFRGFNKGKFDVVSIVQDVSSFAENVSMIHIIGYSPIGLYVLQMVLVPK
jgi:hypothetical protein